MFVELFAQKPLLLSPNHSYKDALDWSREHLLYTVPILNDTFLTGYLNIENLKKQDISLKTPIAELLPYHSKPLFVYSDEHVFDAILKLEYQDTIAILNTQNKYVGIITIHQISEIFKSLQLNQIAGSTLVLSIRHKDYCLSEIARIAESCDAKILSLFISPHSEEGYWYLHLKFNTEDLSRLVDAYERFGYQVAYVHQKQLSLSDTQNNYETLMKFLEI